MKLAELRLFQTIQCGRIGQESYFTPQRFPGVVLERHDGYCTVTIDGETFGTEAANVRSWKPLTEPDRDMRAEAVTLPDVTKKPGRRARIQQDGAVKVEKEDGQA